MSAYISEMKLVAQKVERALCSVHKGGLPLSLPGMRFRASTPLIFGNHFSVALFPQFCLSLIDTRWTCMERK